MWAVMPRRKIRYKPFVSLLLQVYKTGLNYQSVLSCLPVECARCFRVRWQKRLLTARLKETDCCCQSWGWTHKEPALPFPHLANRSQVLSCWFCPYPRGSQESSTFSELHTSSSSYLLTTVVFHQPLVCEAPPVYWPAEYHYRVCFYLYPY